MKLFRQLHKRQTEKQTDRETNGLTELFLKSLSRLKSVVMLSMVWLKEKKP